MEIVSQDLSVIGNGQSEVLKQLAERAELVELKACELVLVGGGIGAVSF